MDHGIGYWVTRQAFLAGDRAALIDGERVITYGELDARTSALARGLAGLGVRRFDRVALLAPNSAEFVETLFACAKLGAICVPVNFRLAPPEVAYALTDSGADVLVTHASFAETAHGALAYPGIRVRHTLVVGDLPADHALPHLPYADVLDAGNSATLEMAVEEADVHAIMYTSGTTGRPKGAMLTHANTIANARNAVMMGRGLNGEDVTVTAAPMFHIGGLGVHSLPFVYVGATNVIQAAFDPAELLALMARHRVSVQFLVPAMWAAVMRVPGFDDHDLSALKLAVSGGAPTPLTVIDFFQARGIPFQEGFGMTETAPAVSMLDAEHVKSKSGSIGRPLFHVEARIVDDDDRDRPSGTVGELVLRGANIFAGYWMLPEATAEAFRGGWFHTGDLGRIDDEGFITLVDRKKDMIITGGENVYPIEVEQVLHRFDGVAEAAVIGVPDDQWGESVTAVVVLEPGATAGAADLIAHTRAHLAHFKCPRHVEFAAALPRNATGKIRKTELRRTYGPTSSTVTR